MQRGYTCTNQESTGDKSLDALAEALKGASQSGSDSVLIISADAAAPHQAVVTVMEAARRVGLTKITFATQSSATAGAGAGARAP